MQKKNITILASLGILFVTVIWGFAFVVVKNSLDAVPPLYMMAFRFSIAALMLSLVFCRRFASLTKAAVIHGTGIGIALFLAYAFQTIGCKYTTAGKNAFLTTFYVILVPFINWALVKNKPDFYSLFAAVLSITGIGLLSLRGDLTMNIGDVLTLICGFCYALQIVFIARYSQNDDPVMLAVLQIIVSAVLSWIAAPLFEGPFPLAAVKDTGVIGSMLYLGLLSTMVAFLLQNVCQKYTPPSTASILMSFEAVFGMLFSVIFLHEPLSLRGFAGCLLMFVAVIVSETKLSFLRPRKAAELETDADKK